MNSEKELNDAIMFAYYSCPNAGKHLSALYIIGYRMGIGTWKYDASQHKDQEIF